MRYRVDREGSDPSRRMSYRAACERKAWRKYINSTLWIDEIMTRSKSFDGQCENDIGWAKDGGGPTMFLRRVH